MEARPGASSLLGQSRIQEGKAKNMSIWPRVILSMTIWAAIIIQSLSTASAQPPSDASSIWTLQDENSSLSTEKLHDRYYVNGLRFSWTSPTDVLPHFFSVFDRMFLGDGRQRISVELAQMIYTPANTLFQTPDPHDRPYAGVLTATFSLIHDRESSRSALGAQFGLIGPDAGAGDLQNGFHDFINNGQAQGWAHQIQDEPVLEFFGQRVWRLALRHFGALETDVLPEVQAGVGSLRIYGLTGAVLRIGQGLDSDFGVPRVRPGLTGLDAYQPNRPVAWYGFAGIDGQAVAYDITLDGTPFRSSPHVTRLPLMGEVELGLGLIVHNARISVAQILQSHDFVKQQSGMHQFGSMSVSVRF